MRLVFVACPFQRGSELLHWARIVEQDHSSLAAFPYDGQMFIIEQDIKILHIEGESFADPQASLQELFVFHISVITIKSLLLASPCLALKIALFWRRYCDDYSIRILCQKIEHNDYLNGTREKRFKRSAFLIAACRPLFRLSAFQTVSTDEKGETA